MTRRLLRTDLDEDGFLFIPTDEFCIKHADMPGHNGLIVSRKLEDNEVEAHIPLSGGKRIIARFVTRSVDIDDLCRRLRADETLRKKFCRALGFPGLRLSSSERVIPLSNVSAGNDKTGRILQRLDRKMQKQAIGKRLKQARKALGESQKSFAVSIGIGFRSYQDNERGINAPGALVLAGCARRGISADWLLTGKGSMCFRPPASTEE